MSFVLLDCHVFRSIRIPTEPYTTFLSDEDSTTALSDKDSDTLVYPSVPELLYGAPSLDSLNGFPFRGPDQPEGSPQTIDFPIPILTQLPVPHPPWHDGVGHGFS